MRKTIFVFFSTLVLLLSLAVTVPATPIVDTGEYDGAGYVLSKAQWLAGQFTLTQKYTVTAVQGFIGYRNGGAGEVTAVLYTDNGQLVPYVTVIKYSQTFAGSVSSDYTWQGPSGLNWVLTAGTYWLAFEVDESSSFSSSMSYPVPSPLSYYAVANNGGSYHNAPDLDVGMRVFGTQSPVPLPPTVLLLGSGLLGLVGWKRFRKG